MIAVKFRGLREIQAKFGKLPEKAREIMGDAVLEGAEVTAKHIRAEAPVRSGTLRDSISIRFRWPDEAWVFVAEPAHTYALFTELGTRPHMIRPVSGKALRFDIDGIVFAKYVFHPGTRPNPFFDRGFRAAEKEVNRILDKAIDEMVRYWIS